MPKKRPVFLFSFSNDPEAMLRVEFEQDVCNRALALIQDQDLIEQAYIPLTNLINIYDELDRFNNRIYFFHYGGHSNEKGLNLTDTIINSKSLATILGRQKKLKLVFLNGCANVSQVETLWAGGVKAIIATKAEINDFASIQLSKRFYNAIASGQTILEAFKTAESFISNDQKRNIEIKFRGQGLLYEEDFPWGLYVQDENILNWSINDIEKEDISEILDDLHKGSNERFQNFTSQDGRFKHLKIDNAILAGISEFKNNGPELIHDNIELDGENFNLLAAISNLWEKDCPHAMIIGEGGMGKTISLLEIWKNLLDKTNIPVPIFIQLNEFNNWSVENFIQKHIRKHYADVSLDLPFKAKREKQDDKRIPRLILLLDGYNEVTARIDELNKEVNRLKVLDNFPGIQIIITSRIDIRERNQWQNFHLLQLQPLRNDQIERFLNAPLPEDSGLVNLLRYPMMLSIYGAQSELPKTYNAKGYLNEQVNSIGEMLFNVEAIQRIKIEQTNENDIQEVAYQRFIVEHLLPYIAWKMQIAGMFFIHKRKSNSHSPSLQEVLLNGILELLKESFFETFTFFDDFLKVDAFKKDQLELFQQIIHQILVSKYSLLVREDKNYRFLHQNFRDYFAARHLQNQIEIALKSKYLPKELKDIPLDFNVRKFLGELEGEHNNKVEWNTDSNNFYWNQEDAFLENNLTSFLDQCREVQKRDDLGFSVWNLLMIWKDLRNEFSGMNLDGLNFNQFSFNRIRTSRFGLSATFNKVAIIKENFFSPGHKTGIKVATFIPDGKKILTQSNVNVKVWDSKTGKYLYTLEHRDSSINIAKISPCGMYILTCDFDSKAIVWDAQTGKHLHEFEEHSSRIFKATFSPDGKSIITCGMEETIVWDTLTGEWHFDLQGEYVGTKFASFSPGGKYILTSFSEGFLSDEKNSVIVWDTSDGQELIRLSDSEDITSAVFNPKENCITTIAKNGSTIVWDIKKEEKNLSFDCTRFSIYNHEFIPTFNPSGDCIIISSRSKSVNIWDITTGEVSLTLKGHSSKINSAKYSSDGQKILTSSNDKTVKIWDAFNGQCILTLVGHSGYILSAEFSSNNKQIITGSSDKTSKVWDVSSGQCLFTIEGSKYRITSSDFSPNGKYALLGSGDKTVKIWALKHGVCLLTLEGHLSNVTSACYSPDGSRILTALGDGSVYIWDAKIGKCLRSINAHSKYIRSICFSPDGNQFITGSDDKTVKVWNLSTWDCILILREHTHQINSVCYSFDGNYILSTSNDRTAKVWNSSKGNCILSIEEPKSQIQSGSFSPDGRYILFGGTRDYSAKIWNIKNRECLLTLEGHSGFISAVKFSPNGKFIITGSSDASAKIWDAQSGQCLNTLIGHRSAIRSVSFSPDGKKVLTGSDDSTAKVWDSDTGKCLDTLTNISGLLIQGADFRDCHPNSNLSEEDILMMRQYGAIFNDEDKKRWDEIVKEYLDNYNS